jgi:hypothetical protein
MEHKKSLDWVLRIAVAGEFFGHGILAFTNAEPKWGTWVQQFIPVDSETAVTILAVVGAIDILLAILVLIRPWKPALLWMIFWGFFTALLRPLVGESFWGFVERWANWGAPLALYIMYMKGQWRK